MAERERKQKPAPKAREAETAEVDAPKAQGEKIKEELDELLDENAEEFVRNYVQKGGE